MIFGEKIIKHKLCFDFRKSHPRCVGKTDKQERKEQSITQLNISNGCYVLDQQGNYMFRPLEAIFSLHKIDLEEKEFNIYSKGNGVSSGRNM